MGSDLTIAESLLAAVAGVRTVQMEAIQHRFEDWGNATTHKYSLALGAQGLPHLLRVAPFEPRIDAECAEGILASILRTAGDRLPDNMVANGA